MGNHIIKSVIKQFDSYKMIGLKAMEQVEEKDLFWLDSPKGNSIAIIVKHLHGNMLSRWTDFLNSDGEKEWRKREAEFENEVKTKVELKQLYNEGWDCLMLAMSELTDKDLERIIYIRNEGHTVIEAIHRQLAHYGYHVGQIVILARLKVGDDWKSLSIPRGENYTFNQEKFSKEKSRKQ